MNVDVLVRVYQAILLHFWVYLVYPLDYQIAMPSLMPVAWVIGTAIHDLTSTKGWEAWVGSYQKAPYAFLHLLLACKASTCSSSIPTL